jgi:hypothetical protein
MPKIVFFKICIGIKKAVLRIWDPGSGCLFDPWIQDLGSGMGKKSGSGSEIRDEQPGSYFRKLRNNYFWLNT